MQRIFDNDIGFSKVESFCKLKSAENRPFHPMFNPFNSDSFDGVLSGTTYFAQMIVHELISSTSLPILRRPYFSLDSLYGHSENGNDSLDSYDESLFDENGFFKLGDAISKNGNSIKPNEDLYRPSGRKKAVIADARNDENLFISQLHLLWLKLHNKILAKNNIGSSQNNRIINTRKVVLSIFQHIVNEEFLKKLIQPDLYTSLIALNSGDSLLDDKSLSDAPHIISHAVMRFGHSMARNSYRPNKNTRGNSKPLSHFFNHVNKLNNGDFAISPEEVIYWHLFFDNNCPSKQMAMKIDHFMAPEMARAPLGINKVNILEKNLLAGFFHRVPTPIGLVRKITKKHPNYLGILGIKWFDDVFIKKQMSQWQVDPVATMAKESLWVYVLFESKMLQNSQHSQSFSNSLGVLGSILVSEFILNAMRYSELPIDPASPQIPNNVDLPEYFENIFDNHNRLTMMDIVNFVN